MKDAAALIHAIAGETDVVLAEDSIPRFSPGGIKSAVRDHQGRPWFLKLTGADRSEMLDAERDGLAELAASQSVRVPEVAGTGCLDSRAWLLMEYLDLSGDRQSAAARMGRELASMHRVSAQTFGWRRDNTIGDTPQENDQDSDWIRFFAARRLSFQLNLAAENGYGELREPGLELTQGMSAFFAGYTPSPSLLHGDLWGGNWGASASGQPAIFDPAVYYGDREADLAMTHLFGGFPQSFYRAYEEAWPLEAGYQKRAPLYNLYHVLNHLNLFGSGYLGQARSTIHSLLAELGAG